MVREGVTQTIRRMDDGGRYHRSNTCCTGYRNEDALMLVLSRNVGESIKIDGGIQIFILKSERNQVRIGIDAPRDTKILRTELCSKEKKNG